MQFFIYSKRAWYMFINHKIWPIYAPDDGRSCIAGERMRVFTLINKNKIFKLEPVWLCNKLLYPLEILAEKMYSSEKPLWNFHFRIGVYRNKISGCSRNRISLFVEYFSRSTVQTAKHKIGKQNDIFYFSNLLRGTAIYMNMKKYAVNWHLIGTHSN